MQELKQVLFSIKGVVAVGLGGSRGIGLADENSDFDFVLFRNGGDPIAAKLIVDLIKPLVDQNSILDGAGFVRAQLSGKHIDIFQKDINTIEHEIALAKSGKFNWTLRPLFPHGDLSTCLISHITNLELCLEKNQCVTNLKKLAEPLPLLLRHSLINTFLTEISITLIHASKIRKVKDCQYLIGLCSAYFFYANIIIFTANKQYPIIERGGSEVISRLPYIPQNYNQRITKIFQAALSGDFKFVIKELTELENELKLLANHSFSNLKTISTNPIA